MPTAVSWGRWPRYQQHVIPLTNRFDLVLTALVSWAFVVEALSRR
jgi:hypothetical protein